MYNNGGVGTHNGIYLAAFPWYIKMCVCCVCVCREEAALTYRPTMTFRNSTSTPLMRQARLNPVCVCVW